MCQIFMAMTLDGKSIKKDILEKFAYNMLSASFSNNDGWGLFDERRRYMKSPNQMKKKNVNRIVKYFADAKFIVGHCRAATSGSVCSNNTHPFKIGNNFFVHNGIVRFADSVAIDEKEESDKSDSQKMFEVIMASPKKGIAEKLRDALPKIAGSFSCFLYGEDDVLYYFRETSGFTLALDQKNNMILGATIQDAIKSTYKNVVYGFYVSDDNKISYATPTERVIFIIDPKEGLLSDGKFDVASNGRNIKSYSSSSPSGTLIGGWDYGGGKKSDYSGYGPMYGYGGSRRGHGKWTQDVDALPESEYAVNSKDDDEYDYGLSGTFDYGDDDKVKDNILKNTKIEQDEALDDWTFDLKFDESIFVIKWNKWYDRLSTVEQELLMDKLEDIAIERSSANESKEVCELHNLMYQKFFALHEGKNHIEICPQCVADFLYVWVNVNVLEAYLKHKDDLLNEKIKERKNGGGGAKKVEIAKTTETTAIVATTEEKTPEEITTETGTEPNDDDDDKEGGEKK